MNGNPQRLSIKLTGGGPWGFRLQGGPGTGKPLTVWKVRRKSKAHNHLLIGDLLITANGVRCENLTYDQVMDIADRAGHEFQLDIERKQQQPRDNLLRGITADSNPESPKTRISIRETKTWETTEERIDDTHSGGAEVSSTTQPFSSPVPGTGSPKLERTLAQSWSKPTADGAHFHSASIASEEALENDNRKSGTVLLRQENRREELTQSVPWDSKTNSTKVTEVRDLSSTATKDMKFFTTELEEQFERNMGTKKKKMFSSSSFYEEPYAIYPTVEEQFEMAKKIAESLADDNNKKSKGANMFFRRAKRATKWIHEGPEPSSESGPDTPEPLPDRLCPMKSPQLKLVLDPRHPVDLASLQRRGHDISEHNVVSPEACHGLVRDLESPVGKGSALFAKRKKKSSEWVVDEEKVRERQQNLPGVTKRHLPESLWSPEVSFRVTSTAATRLHPDIIAETVIAAADVKQKDSVISPMTAEIDDKRPVIPESPDSPFDSLYMARAPKGWSNTISRSGKSDHVAIQQSTSTEAFPAYSTLLAHSSAQKYNFQNFNTLPRKWKATN